MTCFARCDAVLWLKELYIFCMTALLSSTQCIELCCFGVAWFGVVEYGGVVLHKDYRIIGCVQMRRVHWGTSHHIRCSVVFIIVSGMLYDTLPYSLCLQCIIPLPCYTSIATPN